MCRGMAEGEERVGGAVHEVGRRLPFPFLGLGSDSGGEFINHIFTTTASGTELPLLCDSPLCQLLSTGDEAGSQEQAKG